MSEFLSIIYILFLIFLFSFVSFKLVKLLFKFFGFKVKFIFLKLKIAGVLICLLALVTVFSFIVEGALI